MLDVLRQDRFTQWVFLTACTYLVIQSHHSPTGHHDLARFATVEALVEHGTWSIEPSRYDTIDKISHEGRLYASKPPLMPGFMAVTYQCIKWISGWTFATAESSVIKTLTLLCIGVPMLLFILAWASFLRAFVDDEWAYRYCLLAGAFGNYVAGFAVVVNNHTLASVTIAGALYSAMLLVHGKRRRVTLHLCLAGGFAGLAPAFEFPCAIASVGITLYLLRHFGWRPMLTAFAPPAAIALAAHFALNLMVTGGSLLPFYIIGDYNYPGSYWNNPRSFDALAEDKIFYAFNILIGHHGIFSCTPIFALSLWSLAEQLSNARRGARFGDAALMLAGTLAVVLPYFVFKTANYGGGTQGFRWLFWLTPFWLVLLIPIATRLKTRATRTMGYGLLGLSMFSALFVQHSPWGQSPVHLLFNWVGIVDY